MAKYVSEIVRSKRRENFFTVHNLIIDHYLKIIKPAGLAVYCGLCRHMCNDSFSTFIGTEKLAEETGLTRSYMWKILKQLEGLRLIQIVRQKAPTPKTTYYICDVPIPGKLAAAPLFSGLDAVEQVPLDPEATRTESTASGTSSTDNGIGSSANKEEQDLLNKTKTNPTADADEIAIPPEPESTDDQKTKHAKIVQAIDEAYAAANAGRRCPWTNTRAFSILQFEIRRHTDYNLALWLTCVKNRFASLDFLPAALEPKEFVGKLYMFANGPLDRYGKNPKENVNGSGKNKSTGAVHDTHQNPERYTKGADIVID